MIYETMSKHNLLVYFRMSGHAKLSNVTKLGQTGQRLMTQSVSKFLNNFSHTGSSSIIQKPSLPAKPTLPNPYFDVANKFVETVQE